MKSYFLCVTQPTNLGDLVINKMLIDELSQYGDVYIDCKNTPDVFSRYLFESPKAINLWEKYGVSLKTGNIAKWWWFIKKHSIDLYFSSPGPIGMGKKNAISYYFQVVNKLLSFAHVKRYRVGNCCSQALTEGRTLETKGVEAFYLRSKKTVDQLISKGADNVSYIPDLAYLLKKTAQKTEKKKTAILSFREVRKNIEQFEAWLDDVVSTLLNNGYEVEFYYQVKADENFIKNLYSRYNSQGVKLRQDMVWFDSLDYYSDKSIVISNRLHSLLVGSVYGALPYAFVDSNPKTSKVGDVILSSLSNPEKYLASLDYPGCGLLELIQNWGALSKKLDEDVTRNCLQCCNIIRDIAN